MPPRLIDTVAEILELSGAAVEKEEGRLAALLPQEVAQTLHVREDLALNFDSQRNGAEGELITFQSEFVDRLFDLVQDKGTYASLTVSDLHLKPGARAAAESRFTVSNALAAALDSNERRLLYACLNFKYTAVSDEKREGQIQCVINEHTLAPVPQVLTQLELTKSQEGASYVALPSLPFKQVYAAARRQARRQILQELSEFRRSLHRRLRRDIMRLNEYYQSLIDEINRKIARRHLEGQEKEEQESRIRATEIERERKIADQREKYAMKVEVAPISLLRLYLPAVVVNLEVRHRKLAREFPVVWNPLLKDFEAAPCESCGQELYTLQACEEKLHLLCGACAQCPQCQAGICRVCHPRKCPRCALDFAAEKVH